MQRNVSVTDQTSTGNENASSEAGSATAAAAPAESQQAADPAFRRWQVRHVTDFTYNQAATRSRNLVRLRPFHDVQQEVREHRVNITPTAEYREFEEVFGNRAARFEIVEPHTAMRIEAESVVDVRQHDPFRAFPADYRRTLPLRWMPWERRMLETYLEPVELPEVQLQELLDYGQGIVQANALDLAESLFALNLELFRQYEYRPGSTSFDTSPYDVYRNRFGVCQDFAQLFICIARLLDIPARYVCGYVNITDESGNPRPGATHAWVEVYLPDIGWKGLDPTNGSLPSGGHIRVATGRHYQDATPTTGWIEPAVQQDLSILVEVVELPLGP